MDTFCKFCVFARYAQEDGVKTQVGCELGRLDIFREQRNVADIYDYQEDDSPINHSVITNRICNTYRTSDWDGGDQPVNKVRLEAGLRLGIVVLLEGEPTMEALGKTISNLYQQTLRPVEVVFVNNQDYNSLGKVRAFISKQMGSYPELYGGTSWRIVDVLERTPHETRVDYLRAADIGVDQLKTSMFYTVMTAGYELPKDFIAKLDGILNDQLRRLSLLKPAVGEAVNGQTVHLGLHRQLGGNAVTTIQHEETGEMVTFYSLVAKIEWLAKDVGQEAMICEYADL